MTTTTLTSVEGEIFGIGFTFFPIHQNPNDLIIQGGIQLSRLSTCILLYIRWFN